MKAFVAALLTSMPLAGCGDDAPPSFGELRDELLIPECSQRGCHDLVGHKGNLHFEGPTAYERLLREGPDGEVLVVPADNLTAYFEGWVRVEPGDPDASFLVRKIENPGPGEGELMPRLDTPLGQEQIDRVRQWIEAGAHE